MLELQLDVYGLGNALMDLQLQITEDELVDLGLEKAAMKLVEVEEQKRLIGAFADRTVHRASGGSAANTMIAVSQLGGKSAYGCMLGDDDFGRAYAREMDGLGILLHTTPLFGQPTGTCVVLITPDAERTMNTHLGASASLDAAHVREEILARAKWLYVEGYLFSSSPGRNAVRKAVDLAKANGVKVAVTFSDGFIVDVFGESLREVVSKADLVFANLHEARKFTGEDAEDDIFAKLCSSAPNAVMTMSERGSRVYFSGQSAMIAPFLVHAVDDTGAGDMFAGGFLYGITHGLSGQDAGRLACFLASRVVSQMGPRLRGDVRTLLRDSEFSAWFV